VRVSDGPGSLPELLRAAHVAGAQVRTADVDRPTLDNVFLALTGRSLRESTTTQVADAISQKDAA
jgi:ABC-2 type transport system ATP-binding protein